MSTGLTSQPLGDTPASDEDNQMREATEADMGDTKHNIQEPAPTASPADEALSWWKKRTESQTYIGAREELPSPAAVKVLRTRELIAETPTKWGFVVRSPQVSEEAALRANAWGLVAVALEKYEPAAIDRTSAVRLAIGDEAIPPMLHVRHGQSASKREIPLLRGYVIALNPDSAMSSATALSRSTEGPPTLETNTVTLATAPAVTLRVIAAAPLLTTLTLGDLRDNLDTIVIWLRTLVVGSAALEKAFAIDPKPVILKRMGVLARDAGNERLAKTIEEVLEARNRSTITTTHTMRGELLVIPRYISAQPPASSPWLERQRVGVARAFETVSKLLDSREANLPRLGVDALLVQARAAKLEDTYHSTTIEGYIITREEVLAVLEGKPYKGRTPEEIERLMALKGYSKAFDWTLGQILASKPPVERASITEDLILNMFVELWSPSIDAGVVGAPSLRGWRTTPVHIRESTHVPPAWEKVSGLMTSFVTQINEATVGPLTRAIVAHWSFVNVHPFKDGNGRVARLLMNYLMGSAGLPWTTIRAEQRAEYFQALERAHMQGDLAPFAELIAGAVEKTAGKTG